MFRKWLENRYGALENSLPSWLQTVGANEGKLLKNRMVSSVLHQDSNGTKNRTEKTSTISWDSSVTQEREPQA